MDRTRITLLVIYALLSLVGDVVSTMYSLSHGAIEANPLFPFIGMPGLIVLKVLFFAWIIYLTFRLQRYIFVRLLLALNIFLLFVVVNNFTHFAF